jgi:hypothetical protein
MALPVPALSLCDDATSNMSHEPEQSPKQYPKRSQTAKCVCTPA